MAALPVPAMARAVSAPRSSRTSPTATLAPASTISRAVSAPMPRAAPDINATFPSRRFIALFPFGPVPILSALLAQRQPDAEPDQQCARAPALNALPKRVARDQPGERSAGQRDSQ